MCKSGETMLKPVLAQKKKCACKFNRQLLLIVDRCKVITSDDFITHKVLHRIDLHCKSHVEG